MERRISSRAQVDLPICALVDGFRHACRAVDLSTTGMVFERSRGLFARELPGLAPFEIYLDGARDSRRSGGARPIRVRGRSVWTRDRLSAVRFVVMNDVDRLTIAEQLDRMVRLKEALH
jgi:hypothetical protein